MADINAIATAFVSHYYQLLDQPNKAGIQGLTQLYKPQSMMTWEQQNLTGPEAIGKAFMGMSWTNVRHNVTATAAQPSGVPNALIVMVNGQMIIDTDQPMNFSQVWHLLQENGSFWIHNDIFKLSFA